MIPFDASYFSHKFHNAGVSYNVALNIETNDIVYWGGVYSARKYPALVIGKIGIASLLLPGQKVLDDKWYDNKNHFIFPTNLRGYNSLIKMITARYKNMNARLKCWRFLRNRFRQNNNAVNHFSHKKS